MPEGTFLPQVNGAGVLHIMAQDKNGTLEREGAKVPAPWTGGRQASRVSNERGWLHTSEYTLDAHKPQAVELRLLI